LKFNHCYTLGSYSNISTDLNKNFDIILLHTVQIILIYVRFNVTYLYVYLWQIVCLYREGEREWDRIQKMLNLARRVAQVIDCLPSKHEALNSNPSTATQKKKISEGAKSSSAIIYSAWITYISFCGFVF
jgi:hypothetical protein